MTLFGFRDGCKFQQGNCMYAFVNFLSTQSQETERQSGNGKIVRPFFIYNLSSESCQNPVHALLHKIYAGNFNTLKSKDQLHALCQIRECLLRITQSLIAIVPRHLLRSRFSEYQQRMTKLNQKNNIVAVITRVQMAI